MRTDLSQQSRSNGFEVYVIQMILAVNPSRPEWSDVNWGAFHRGEMHSYTHRYEEYFANSKEGKKFFRHKDRPAHYYGEKFWSDVPAFMTSETAHKCRRAMIDGGWCKGRETRVAKWSLVESVEVIPEPQGVRRAA